MENNRQETAAHLFDTHPDKEIVYFTSDNVAFFEKHNAEAHATSLEDRALEAYDRPSAGKRSLLEDMDPGEGEDDSNKEDGTGEGKEAKTPATDVKTSAKKTTATNTAEQK